MHEHTIREINNELIKELNNKLNDKFNDKHKIINNKLKKPDKIIQIDKTTFEHHMNIINKNINNICKYIKFCNIYLDNIINLLTVAYKCLLEINSSTNDCIVYNTSRIKINNLMRINMITKTSFIIIFQFLASKTKKINTLN